jgi:alpha-tubulin suppressor-like RCC1 family protein
VGIQVGQFFSCGLYADGRVACWGANWESRNGTGAWRNVPTVVPTSQRFARLRVQYNKACGITATGALWCWGYNGDGALGLGDFTERSTPTQAGGALLFKDINGSAGTTCGITTDDRLFCWGSNTTMQAGQPVPLTPQPVRSATTFLVP